MENLQIGHSHQQFFPLNGLVKPQQKGTEVPMQNEFYVLPKQSQYQHFVGR